MLLFSKEKLKELSVAAGFDLCAVVEAKCVPLEVKNRVEEWIEKRYNGTMEWFNRNKPLRYNPLLLHEGCTSVVVCAISYQTVNSFSAKGISDYATQSDYHYIIKAMLSKLNAMMEEECGEEVNSRAFCDSAPILERFWAAEGGLGWIGRNGMLINRELGSWFFIGVLLTPLKFDSYDCRDSFNGCGHCSKCVDSCSSSAILENGVIDCNRCVAYLTIEHKGDYSPLQQQILEGGNQWFFGCDDCIKVCPWNVKAMNELLPCISKKRSELFEREKYCFPSEKSEINREMVKNLKKTALCRFNFRNE